MSPARARLAALLVLAAYVFAPTVGLAQTSITFQYFYDETGQLTRAVDSTGIVIEWVYDAVGNILEIKRSGVTAGQLTILGLTPSQGGIGAAIEIQGQGFSTAPSGNTVLFNGTPAQVVSAAAGRLSVLVPAGASSGPVSVTVGGNTVVSPNPFTVLATPLLTSITPKSFDANRPPASIRVTGLNLAGSSFALLPAFTPPPVALGSPQFDLTGTVATLPLTALASAHGTFVLVATNTFGSSDAFPSAGNTLAAINAQDDDSDGDGFPDGLELLFGSDPFLASSVPNLATQARSPFSVQNIFVAPTALQTPFAVQNIFVTPPAIQTPFSVQNTFITSPTPQTFLSGAFSVSNVVGSLPLSGASRSSLNASQNGAGTPDDAIGLSLGLSSGGGRLIEGQTVVVNAAVSGGAQVVAVDFLVNNAPVGTDTTAPYELTFTVPVGVGSLAFVAAARDASGAQIVATSMTAEVDPNVAISISGRVVSAFGNPVAGAVVDVLSDGLDAEFFDADGVSTAMPDLTGRTPDRTTRATAVNMRNPGGVFGEDPLGSRLVPAYVARFTGWLNVTAAGLHSFHLGASDGAKLVVGGTTVVEIGAGAGDHEERSVDIALVAGLVPVEVTFYQRVGHSEIQLAYTPPGGVRQVVPPAVLIPSGRSLVTTTDSAGFFTLRNAPAAIQSLRVRATTPVSAGGLTGITDSVSPVPSTDLSVGDIVVTVP
jgi:YD repeat-containing protein